MTFTDLQEHLFAAHGHVEYSLYDSYRHTYSKKFMKIRLEKAIKSLEAALELLKNDSIRED